MPARLFLSIATIVALLACALTATTAAAAPTAKRTGVVAEAARRSRAKANKAKQRRSHAACRSRRSSRRGASKRKAHCADRNRTSFRRPSRTTRRPSRPAPSTPTPGTPSPGGGDTGTPNPGTPNPGGGDTGTPDPGTPNPGGGDTGTPNPGGGDTGTPNPGGGDTGTPNPGGGDTGTPNPGGGANGWNGFGAHNWPGADWRPYGADSPFNQATAAAAATHPQSAQYVQKILSWNKPASLVAGTADTTRDYAHPIYYAQPDDPIFTLHATGTRNSLEGMRIRIPDEARPAGGSDGHLAVVQPDGWSYDFWAVQSKPSGGGTFTYQIGGRTRIDGDGLDGKSTASNFGALAGVIRAAELAAGRIDHALFVVLRCTSNTTAYGYDTKPAPSNSQGSYVWPALHGGAPCDSAAPPMGARVQLDMTSAQINALSVPTWKKAILRALATYGGYVGDTGGPGFGFQFESASAYTSFGAPDPLVQYAKSIGLKPGAGDWSGTYAFDTASGVDWARYLRFVVPPTPAPGATLVPRR